MLYRRQPQHEGLPLLCQLGVNRYTSDFDGKSASTSSGRAPKGGIDDKGQELSSLPH
jgi:hypothetical protein